MRARSPIDDVGFSIPYGCQTWRRFAADGGLGRTLLRMCALAEGAIRLSFEIDRAMTEGVVVRLFVEGEPLVVAGGVDALDEDALSPLASLLRRLNEALAARESPWRFVVGIGPPEGDTNFGHRLAMLPAAAAAEVAAEDWVAENCLPEGPPAPSPPVAAPPPPRVRTVEELVGEGACLVADPGYPDLLAAHVERLVAFAGAGNLRCRPTPSLAEMFSGDSFFTLRLTRTYPGGGTLQDTVRIRLRPSPDLQPIFDRINGWLDGQEASSPGAGRRRLYRCTRRPWGEQAVLATDDEAAELRRAGYLIELELPGRARERLAAGGFELPAFHSEWRYVDGRGVHAEGLCCCLARTVALARGRFTPALAIELHAGADGRPRVTFAAGERARSWAWAGPATRPAIEVLAALFGALNEFAADCGSDQRFAILTAEPQAYAPRLLLVGPAWRAAVLRERGLVRGCFDPATETEAWATVAAPRAHPAPALDEELPRLPLPEEIVGARHVQDSDYKCPARESDLPSVFDQIAEFAGVAATCAPLARHDPDRDGYDLTVSWRGAETVIRMSSHKYADAQPIVDYLNAVVSTILASRDGRRLYRFRAGQYGGGVLLATDAQAAELRALAYLVEPGDR